jgi:hypothetical protein
LRYRPPVELALLELRSLYFAEMPALFSPRQVRLPVPVFDGELPELVGNGTAG